MGLAAVTHQDSVFQRPRALSLGLRCIDSHSWLMSSPCGGPWVPQQSAAQSVVGGLRGPKLVGQGRVQLIICAPPRVTGRHRHQGVSTVGPQPRGC